VKSAVEIEVKVGGSADAPPRDQLSHGGHGLAVIACLSYTRWPKVETRQQSAALHFHDQIVQDQDDARSIAPSSWRSSPPHPSRYETPHERLARPTQAYRAGHADHPPARPPHRECSVIHESRPCPSSSSERRALLTPLEGPQVARRTSARSVGSRRHCRAASTSRSPGRAEVSPRRGRAGVGSHA
jgi:hypothetical protein